MTNNTATPTPKRKMSRWTKLGLLIGTLACVLAITPTISYALFGEWGPFGEYEEPKQPPAEAVTKSIGFSQTPGLRLVDYRFVEPRSQRMWVVWRGSAADIDRALEFATVKAPLKDKKVNLYELPKSPLVEKGGLTDYREVQDRIVRSDGQDVVRNITRATTPAGDDILAVTSWRTFS